jgi:hypothetical protein
MRSNQQEYNWLPTGQTMYQAMEQARFLDLQRRQSMDQAIKQARLAFAGLERSNSMDQVMTQAKLAELKRRNSIELAELKRRNSIELAELERRLSAELERRNSMLLAAREAKLMELLTYSKEIKTVFEKETHDLIMPSKDPIIDKMLSTLPEDLQAILEDMQKRWIKKQYSHQKIRYLTFRYLFDMILGYVKSQIENIWLPKSSSTKEIE